MTAVFDNLMDGISCVTSRWGWKWDDVVIDVGMRLSDIAHQDYVAIGRTVDDILQAHANGQLALVLCLEAATPIENEVDRLDVLYGLGVRQIGVAYSEYEKVPYVAGLENPTENFFNIVGWLVKHGYSDEDIKAVTGGNILRALKETWQSVR